MGKDVIQWKTDAGSSWQDGLSELLLTTVLVLCSGPLNGLTSPLIFPAPVTHPGTG